MASEKAKELAAKQKAAIKAEKLRKKNSDDPRDWGQMRQLREVWKMTAQHDKQLNLFMGLAFAGAVAVVVLIAALLRTAGWLWIMWGILALMFGALAALFVLTNRAKKATFARYAGQPGSSDVALQMLNKKKYSYDLAITATRQLDIVHRVLGPCGVVLLGEGQPGRVRPLLAQEAKRHEHVAQGTKVTTIMVGSGEGQTPIDELQKKIEKLPKAMEAYQVAELKNRLKALDAVRPKAPLPKGPMPTIKGVNRAMRGR